MLKYSVCDCDRKSNNYQNFASDYFYCDYGEDLQRTKMPRSRPRSYGGDYNQHIAKLDKRLGRLSDITHSLQQRSTSMENLSRPDRLGNVLHDIESKINEALEMRNMRSRKKSSVGLPYCELGRTPVSHSENFPERLNTFLQMREKMARMYEAIDNTVTAMQRLSIDRRSVAKFLWLRERVASQLDETGFLYSLYKQAMKRKELALFEKPRLTYEEVLDDIDDIERKVGREREWQAMAKEVMGNKDSGTKWREKPGTSQSPEKYRKMLSEIESEAETIKERSKESASELTEELRALTEHCRKMTIEVADLNEVISEKRENLQEITDLYQEAEEKLQMLSNQLDIIPNMKPPGS